MSQVSRFRIAPQTWDRIFDMFLDSFLFAKDKKKLTAYVDSIFTPTERIMLAKRFAACVLLAKGNDYRSVSRKLRMSVATICKMSFLVKHNSEGITPIINSTLDKQAKLVIKEEVKDLLDIASKGNYKSPERYKRKLNRKQRIEEIKATF